jgi:hypothetical protein
VLAAFIDEMNSIPTNGKGVFVIGDKVKVTLTLNKRIILANVGSNKIVIAGKEFQYLHL